MSETNGYLKTLKANFLSTSISRIVWIAIVLIVSACTTLPAPDYEKYSFPKEVFRGTPKDRKFKVVASVRARVEFATLDMQREENRLCQNYFNKAAKDLLKYAKQAGGDAVIEVKSVTFLLDGKMETHDTAECSDDGAEGQILAIGKAIKWIPEPKQGSKL